MPILPGVSVRLEASLRAARAVGALSRATGRGGGTTLPGRVLDGLAPRGVEQLADGLPLGSAAISATNGKTTTCAWSRRSSIRRVRLCRNAAGANLLSGIAAALVDGAGGGAPAELGLFECDEAALPRSCAARGRTRSRSATSSATSSTATASSRPSPSAGAHARRAARRDDGDRLRRRSADGRHHVRAPALRELRHRRSRARPRGRSRTPPTRASASAAARRTTTRPSGSATSATTAARAAATPGRSSRSRRSEIDAARARGGHVRAAHAGREPHASSSRVPGLYNVENALAASGVALALGASLDEIARGPRALPPRVRALPADRARATARP